MNQFAVALAKTIGSHPALVEFGIDATVMAKNGWKTAFASLGQSQLGRLVLNGVQLGDMGMHGFCEGIRGNQALLELELDNNCITLNGLLDLRGALRQCRTIQYMPLPINDIGSILQSAGKPGTSKWRDVNLLVGEIAALIASVGQGRPSAYETLNQANRIWELQAPEQPMPAMEVPAEILPQHEVPPKYRDKKAWQEWKLSKMDATLGALSHAALSGGYVAGGASSGGGGGGGGSSSSVSISGPTGFHKNEPSIDPSAAFGANTLDLLADLDLGDGDDYAYDNAEYPADEGAWEGDQTIRVESKRAPPLPPSF